MHIFQRETCRRRTKKKKMCLSRRGFYKRTTVPKPPGCGKCQNLSKIESERDVPCRRTRTDPQAGLGAPFLGCAHVELPLPFVRSTQLPFLSHLCLKTRFSTPISPLYLLPIPPKCTYLFENRVFLRSTAWRGSLSCPFLIFHS